MAQDAFKQLNLGRGLKSIGSLDAAADAFRRAAALEPDNIEAALIIVSMLNG